MAANYQIFIFLALCFTAQTCYCEEKKGEVIKTKDPVAIDTTTAVPTTNGTTLAPNSTTATIPTTVSTTTKTTTAVVPTTKATTTAKPAPTPAPVTTPSTTTTSSTTSLPATTVTPAPRASTIAPAPSKDRSFDGLSFIGGMVLAVGLLAMGVVAFKFYKARDGSPSYLNL